MTNFSKEHRTDKFSCKRCKNRDMIPNKDGDYVRGFVCQICGEINYPTKEKAHSKSQINLEKLKELDKTEILNYLKNVLDIE